MGQSSSLCSVCGELEFNQEEKFKNELQEQLLEAVERGDHEAVWNILSDAEEANVELHSTSSISSPIRSPSHLAALRGNSRALHALWYGKFPVDQPLYDGRTPLFLAVVGPRDKAESVVRILIDAQVNINWAAQHGDTALFNATLVGRVELIHQLAKAGATIDCATHHGTTPLMVASERGDIASVKALLSLKADVKRASTSGSTALHAAAELGHGDTANLLIEAGANVNARRRGGATPLYVACAHGWAHVVDFLCIADADVNLACVDGQTPLHAVLEWAAHGRDVMVAAFGDTSHVMKQPELSLHSSQVKSTDRHSDSITNSPKVPSVKFSFQSPFPTSKSSKYKTNPELVSVEREANSPRVSRRPRSFSLPVVHEDVDEEDDEDDEEFGALGGSMLDKGNKTQSVNDGVTMDNTSSSTTIRVPSLALRIIESLLNHGANTSACLIGGNGESPLHLACRHGLVGCARLLAPHSNVRLTAGDEGTTPLHLAARFGYNEIIDILLKADEEAVNDSVVCSSREHDVVVSNQVCSYVNMRDAGGEAPLHLAARFGEVGAIRKLVEAGAQVDARRLCDQATPLTVAALFNRISAAKLLVRLGASLRPMRVADLESTTKNTSSTSSNSVTGMSNTPEGSSISVIETDQAVWSSPAEQAMEWGHRELADHLNAVEKAGYLAWLAAPRLQLVHLRILTAAGRATFLGQSLPLMDDSKNLSGEDSTSRNTRHGRQLLRKSSSRKVVWTNEEVEKALRFVLGAGRSENDDIHAPDNVFAIIATFWWP